MSDETQPLAARQPDSPDAPDASARSEPEHGKEPTSDDAATHPAAGAPGPHRGELIGQGVAWTARWSGRFVLIALALVALGLVVEVAWSILLPVMLALLITSALEKPVRLLETYLRFPPALAAATILLGSLGAVVALGFALAPAIGGQSADIADDAVEGLQKIQDWVQGQDFVTQDQVDAALQAAQDRVTSSGDAIAAGVLTGVSAVTSIAITLVLALVLTFFFLKDGRRFRPLVRRAAGPVAGEHLSEVMGRSWLTLGGYIRTQGLVSFIDAVIIGAGLLIVGVPLAIPLAVLTFFGGFIPIVGAITVGALSVLVALVSNGLTGALIVLAIIVAVQQLEGNVLSPWLQSKSMQLHAAVVLLSVALGSTLFGIIGAFLAVPVVAVAAVVLRYLDEVLTERTHEPGPTSPGVDLGEEPAPPPGRP